jgi:hypothetical protein
VIPRDTLFLGDKSREQRSEMLEDTEVLDGMINLVLLACLAEMLGGLGLAFGKPLRFQLRGQHDYHALERPRLGNSVRSIYFLKHGPLQDVLFVR